MEDVFMPFDDDRYNKGLLLQEYKGTYYLVAARGADDGKVYANWGFPQGKDRNPIDKAVPWKIKLGDSQEEAFKILAFFGRLLKPNGR
jgi:hypothetical protein